MTTARPDSRLGTNLGPYRIESVIGRGGMGVVYLAEQPSLGRKVALKVIAPEFSEEPRAKARFLRESQMAAAIDHPNILPIHEAGEIDGVLFIAMRYVEGEDLARRLAREPVSPRAAIAILAQVAAALDAAHARGLIHRDVKPANILLDPKAGPDGSDHAYLTDFGLTKRGGSEGSLTAVGGFAGTLAYIAPEQVEGGEVDGRTDEYSLASVAYECLTGRPPFERETDIALAMAHLRDPVPSAAALRPELPASIDAALARGLAKLPGERYESCSMFVRDLRDALEISASDVRISPPPASRMHRQRRLWLPLGIAATLLILAGAWLASSGAESGASASLSPSIGTAASPSQSPSKTLQGPVASEGPFPSEPEASLLAAIPADLAATCLRGSYGLINVDPNLRHPEASLTCSPPPLSGANAVNVRQFQLARTGAGTDFVNGAISVLARKYGTKGGDCMTANRVNGRWQVGSADAGAIVCYVEPTSGDAHLWWSYKDASILVEAVNQHGDAKDLRGYFETVARFIAQGFVAP